MSWYRRANFPGGLYFFTVITHQRRPFLTDPLARNCLRYAWRRVAHDHPFELIAVCLLPDHLHCIWRLPPDDNDFSTRWSRIKAHFTRQYLQRGGREGIRNPSRQKRTEAAIWQRRFWEHQIRDEQDLQRHLDYIHYNPVKHALVTEAQDWPWSTYHRFVKQGIYQPDSPPPIIPDPADFGE